MKHPCCAFSYRRRVRGVVLLDALVAIVIFSIGILGLVNLLASAVSLTTDANYRLDAAMIADQVIGQMWGDNSSTLEADYIGSGGSGGTKYAAWVTGLGCGSGSSLTNCLPGISANPPSIAISQTNAATRPNDYLVTVTVYWKSPEDQYVHQYVTTTQIGQ
jgi:type IV pilus assembly protein PilV